MENNATSTRPTGRDLHSPANVVPEDYSYHGCWEPLVAVSHNTAMTIAMLGDGAAQAFNAERAAAVERHKALRAEIAAGGYDGNFAKHGTCDHCGTYFRYGSIFRHEATGHLIVVGWTCAEETFEVPSKAALDQKRARERAAGGRSQAKAADAVQRWIEEDPTRADVLAWLRDNAAGNEFYTDLLAKLVKYGPLSPGQEAAARKGPAQLAARAERMAADALAGPVPVGRVALAGRVASLKWQTSDFGDTLKMLVVLDNGSKVWGSVPQSLRHLEPILDRDDTVSFTGTVEVSQKDQSFGFFKRPAKAERTAVRDGAEVVED